MNISASTPAPTSSRIDFHRGEVLVRLSETYSKLPQTIQECAQNGFDAGADRILIFVDLKQRTVIVLDNGTGTDRKKFEEALASVGHSVKDKSSLGKFGLGLISPLNKCTSFTFTSKPLGQRRAIQWTFRVSDIMKQRSSVEIPWVDMPRLPRLHRRFDDFVAGEFEVPYQTMVQMNGVTVDRVISNIDLDDLAYNIRTKFAIPMRKRKAMVRLVLIDANGRLQTQDVSPLEYSGEPMEVVRYETEETGLVEFELYRARRVAGQRKGSISVMALDDNYPVTMTEFVAQARRKDLADVLSDALKVLTSGYFEGMIKCEKIELSPNRKRFNDGEPLEMLYLVIDQWYMEVGRSQHADEQDQSRHARWQQSGLEVLNKIHERLHTPDYSALWENLRTVVQFGRMGDGHLDPQNGKPNGLDDDPSLRVGQGGGGVPRTPSVPGGCSIPGPRQKDPKDRPGDTPMTASGTSGQRRRLVKGDSQGLQLAHAELAGDSRLWSFDFSDGTITFNTLHSVWVKLDETKGRHLAKNKKWIAHLQEWLTLQVLHLLLHYPHVDEFEQRRDIVDDQIKHYVDLFITNETHRT